VLDPYRTLGLDLDATDDEIRSAWRTAARATHPDLHPEDPHATLRFLMARDAYELLADPDRRARYDANREVYDPYVSPVHPLLGSSEWRPWQRPRLDPRMQRLREEAFAREQMELEARLGWLGEMNRRGLPRGLDLLDPEVRRRYGLRNWKVA
jgi:curved DNA-binding protein CbpA